MKPYRMATGIFAALGMFILILDGKTAMAGAAKGLELCIRSVIPSLFPFFILGGLLTSGLSGSQIPFLTPVGRLFGIPRGAESLLLTGFLGGYPIGAQAVADSWRRGILTKEAAEKMLGYCNHAGPAFLFGIVGPIFSRAYIPWLLWLIHILSALLAARCIPACGGQVLHSENQNASLSDALDQAIKAMARVCGWVMLFRICISFLDRWVLWAVPEIGKVAISGILELANGCLSLSSIPDEDIRFILCAGMLGFGGICVNMQTYSVTDGLRLTYYFPGKILQGCFSMLFAWLLFPSAPYFPIFVAIPPIISILHLRKIEKRSGNPKAVGV